MDTDRKFRIKELQREYETIKGRKTASPEAFDNKLSVEPSFITINSSGL